MATNNLINHYNKRALKGIAEELKAPTTFLLKTFFNNIEEFASDTVDLDIYKGKRRTAAYVRRAEQGQLIDKLGFSTRTFKPPYLKPKTPITPEDIQKRMPGDAIYDNSKSLAPALQNFVNRQIIDQNDMITRNEELQAKQALFDGKVTALDEKGEILAEIDMQRDSDLIYQVGTLWNAGSPLMIKDLTVARRLSQKLSGFNPRLVIMGRDAIDVFMSDDTVRKTLSTDWAKRGQLVWDFREDGAIWHGMVDGFDIWSYEEYIINPATGDEEELIPPKKVLIGSPGARATRTYGMVAIGNTDGTFTTEATARAVDIYGEKDPASTIVQTHSAPLMVTNHPDAYAVLTVLT